ncbi:MAG: FKBP-type peptidyl-prolyl cis-trans isomerase [Burkholderiales bacterium]|nr:FKBP-type peptidyl-prolyl cis-trans isomerase [Burkholderiales bacterium]
MHNLSVEATAPLVSSQAYLTLHYRLVGSDGADIVSTFGSNPATLLLGQGQLAAPLEACLIGLPEGCEKSFTLTPEQAFGVRNEELVRRISKATLAENSAPDAQYQQGDLVDFAAPGGGRFAGVLLQMDDDGALFDFNHPLAGQTLRFDVKIIGIL